MAESSKNNSARQSLKHKLRECEDNTYSRDERQACYRWAQKKRPAGT
jgi:hypothetical protein